LIGKKANKILVKNLSDRDPHGIARQRKEDNIKVDLKIG
jgi:hypothetical protein